MEKAQAILKQYWGYDDFRGRQLDVISSVLKGNDTIALLHTGAGKSLCFQLPALMLPGKTVVISPLIALMQDQVQGLKAKGVPAAAVYSGMRAREVDITLDNFVHGPIKILYLSPERLATDIFRERFKRANISLIAVDEAHCISQWGYDFRPAYFNIKDLREWQPKVPIIAVTATATPPVVLDIVDKLTLKSPEIVSSTFARENISFSVILSEKKEKQLLDIVQKMRGVGIIYMRSRKKVKELSAWLQERHINASYYHGGLPMKSRQRIQEAWQKSDDALIVCTNAFGMGVDKPNVRYVIHLDVPPSIEEYYQEAGRGGRDGKPAYAISLIGHSDVMRLDYNVMLTYPDVAEVNTLYQKLCSHLKVAYGSGFMEAYPFNFDVFCEKYGLSVGKVHSALHVLEKEGWIQLSDGYKNPSTVLITSAKHTITLSSRNKDVKSKILLNIVRRYEGLFIEHTPIDEGTVAKDSGVTEEMVVRELQVMDREHILQYKKTEDGPHVIFLQPRPEPSSFGIDQARYTLRKQRAVERKEAMTDFMLTPICRQQQLLTYFGEESPACGRCDICKGSNEEDFTLDEKDKVAGHISKHLVHRSIGLKDYLMKWPYNKRKKIKACVLALEREKLLDITDDDVISLSKEKRSPE